ncbi:autophagy protein 6 [Wallemia mellicola CBS 633.66]|uniref:Autophagy protein 6 n=1 Tax=Wallemia mellicola (strain ATCC MYA-4683 / CBS 633.66) TaxID=671144 RepID=I4Y8S3_WALMC|nr:autophagy protein 6 [Wallemia mellicola CBS 633.66]EIM20365.1 autophagy protein 6 [Wallemia mellicola CBS 633.66]|eukprot:XP_006959622.1 autophagy protein 6 [Wallemia mellicola CBS 633.66]
MHESESPAVIRMKLFAILTTKSDISHPLCIDCANTALDLLTDEFDDLKRERDAYISFDSVATSIKDQFESQADDDETIRLIERLEKETTEKKSKLDELEKEKLNLEREMRELDAEEEELQGEETAYLRQRSTRLLDDQESIQDQISEQHSLNEAQAELARLERTNVWADVFTISSDSGIGTIAGLRLGRINQNVEWSEINAAWGHLALLLYSVANKLNFEFMNARIIPLGSFSKIEKATLTQNVLKWETLELYHPGSALSMLHTRRFDQAMITFLDMLKQLLDWISARDMTVKWPYKITKERIGDNSIRLPGQFTGDKTADEEWTRALRGLLGTSKVLVQWTTSE